MRLRTIYHQLRQKILGGEWPAGYPLPPQRQLAQELGVARQTLSEALHQLQVEGLLISRVGSGTVVNPLFTLSPPAASWPHLSAWGQRLMGQNSLVDEELTRPVGRGKVELDFNLGRAFATLFPYDIWRKLLDRYLSTDDALLSRYGSVAGFDPLREAVAYYLSQQRGVRCTAEQVVIVSGIQQALDILGRLLLNEGDEVLMERPGYRFTYDLFQAHGAKVSLVPVDNEGFQVENIPAGSQARLVFVTPSNQFPHGGAMPLGRRLALLAWAKDQQAFIIEDDYDGELRYDGYPLASLQGIDPDGRVIYLGTFSKVLFPALRLGYVVLPPALLPHFLQAKQLLDRGAPTLTQAAVADFMSEGHFERHLRHLRQVYGERREALAAALNEHLGEEVQFCPTPAGLHILVRLPSFCSEAQVIQQALGRGVAVYPGAPYYLAGVAPPTLLLGFSGLTVADIQEGVGRLAAVVKTTKSPTLE